MKKLTLLIALVLIISCTESKEKQLVSNYEQRIGNTQTDLNLKFEKFEFIKDVTGKDSLELLTPYFNEKKEKKISQFKEQIEYYENKLKDDKLPPNFVPVELTPPNGDMTEMDLSKWNFRTDLDAIPDWYDEKKARRVTQNALKEFIKEKFLINQMVSHGCRT